MRVKRFLAAIILIACTALAGGAPAQSAGTAMDVTLVTPNNAFADPGLLVTPPGSGYARYFIYRTGGTPIKDASGVVRKIRFGYMASNNPDSFGTLRYADIVPTSGAWWVRRSAPDLWAPHVFFNGSQYVLWYTAINKDTGRRCIGAASSASPGGPFKALDWALMCQNSLDGFSKVPQTIDAAMFLAGDGKRYLIANRHCCNSGFDADGDYLLDSDIIARQVTANGLGLAPNTKNIVLKRFNDQPTIEAPSVVTAGGKVWLFVSRNAYDRCTYKTQVFSATSITAPFYVNQVTLPVNNRSGGDLCGDGGMEVAWDPHTKVFRTAFHAFLTHDGPRGTGSRKTFTGCVGWGTGGPFLRTCP